MTCTSQSETAPFRSSLSSQVLRIAMTAILAVGVTPLCAGVWQSSGPFGAGLGTLATTPDGAVFFAAGSLARSDDGGATWREVNRDVAPGAMAVDAADARHIVAALAGPNGEPLGLFESRDGGATFAALSPFAAPVPTFQVAFDPDAAGVVLAATDVGLLRGDGTGWKSVAPPGSTAALALAISPVGAPEPRVWLVAAENHERTGGNLFRSEDAGKTWLRVAGVFPALQILFDEGHPGRVYGVDGGTDILRSYDDGRTWRRAGRGLAGQRPRQLAIDAQGILHAATDRGLFHSADQGATWRADGAGAPKDDVGFIVAIPGRGLLASAESGPYRAAAGSTVWRPAVRGLRHLNVLDLAIDGRGRTYLAADDVFVSLDGAKTWSRRAAGLQVPGGNPYLQLGASPNGAAVYGGNATYHGLTRSLDGGASWTVLAYDGSNPVTTVAVDPKAANVLYVGGPETSDRYEMQRCHLMKSLDAGRTWSCIALGDGPIIDAMHLEIHPRLRRQLVVASCCGFARSSDGGATWRSVGDGSEYVEAVSAAFTGVDARALVLASATAIFTSQDGATRTVAGAGLPSGARIVSLVADPLRPGDVYVGLVSERGYGHGLRAYVSHDGGASFADLGDGLPRQFTGVLTLDAHRRVLYAATSGRGLFRLALD